MRVSAAIDELVNDRFQLDKALYEFKSDYSNIYQRQIDVLNARIRSQQSELAEAAGQSGQVEVLKNAFLDQKAASLALAATPGSGHLDGRFKADCWFARTLSFNPAMRSRNDLLKPLGFLMNADKTIAEKEELFSGLIRRWVGLYFGRPGEPGTGSYKKLIHGTVENRGLCFKSPTGLAEQFEIIGSIGFTSVMIIARLNPREGLEEILGRHLCFKLPGDVTVARERDNLMTAMDVIRPFTPVLVKVPARKRPAKPAEYQMIVPYLITEGTAASTKGEATGSPG